jgi:hypothetical protein
MKKPSVLFRVRGRYLLAAISLLLATVVLAVPFHSPTIDGVITGNGADWDAADLVVNDIADDNLSRTANVRRLWLTWDQDNLYVGVTYQDFGGSEALSVFFDLDKGVGPRSAAALDSAGGQFLMPEDHAFELVLRRDPAEAFSTDGGSPPRAFLVNDDTGVCQGISDEVGMLAAQGFNTGAKNQDSSRFPFWFNSEFALPWSVIYPDGGGSVPPYAVIKAVAVATSAADTLNGIDSAPNNEGLDGGESQVLLSNLHASVIDTDGDGTPDAADATLSGTATLPGDDGSAGLVITATLADFGGTVPTEVISSATTETGVREWTLSRLPAGTYDVKVSAEGYFSQTLQVEVGQSEAVTGVAHTLNKATAIRGDIGFASGPGADGTIELRDSLDNLLSSKTFTASGGPYVFFVEESGQYSLSLSAETYMDLTRTVDVTAGVDLEGEDFSLIRQTEISGSIVFLDGTGGGGQIDFLDGEGELISSQGFSVLGTEFQFFTPVGGTFSLHAFTSSQFCYVPRTIELDVTAGVDQTGIEVELSEAAYVLGSIAFEGPVMERRLDVYFATTGAFKDSLETTSDDVFEFCLNPGSYRFDFQAEGYRDSSWTLEVGEDDIDLGAVTFQAVRATHLEIVDDEGVTRPEVRATYYNPAAGDPWTSTRVLLAARDEAGRDDLFDLGNQLSNFQLTARKMDDLSPTTGTPVFYSDATEENITTQTSFSDGRAEFWMSNTAVEVLRVYLAQPDKDPVAGRIVVAFEDPQARTVVLTADRDTMTADGVDVVMVSGQLYDSAGNPSLLPDIPVSFSFLSDSSGDGQFEVATTLTNGDGLATARLTATGAGVLQVSASVVIENRILDVEGLELGSGVPYLALVTLPGPTAGWRLSLPSNVSSLSQSVTVTAQLIDQFGNDTAEAGQVIDFTADPAGLGTFDPLSALSDEDGRATSQFTPSGSSGLVSLRGGSGSLSGDSAELQLRDVTVLQDPVWYDEPRTRQTFDSTDLTALVVDNTPDELILEVPFQSDWNGLQLHVIFETNNDEAGANRDPFEQPVNYGHEDRPDFALTSKYSANDYGDFRRWGAGAWEFYDFTLGGYAGSAGDGNIQSRWVDKQADRVVMRIPWGPLGGAPDSLRLQAYLTQDDGEKRSAFDSVPQDSTLNLTFDYEDPQPGDWETALGPVTLLHWGESYEVKTDFPATPTVADLATSPAELIAGQIFTLTARVTDAGDGVGDVLADLSAMGGGALTRMHDDGDSAHGDAQAGDGIYSLQTMVPVGNPGGEQELVVMAYDGGNVWPTRETLAVTVTAIFEPIIVATDPEGDDHGPNQPGVARKFTTYPSNIVFVPGGFDLLGLTVFETVATVSGQQVEMIAFQVEIGDFPDPTDPGTADWNPLYADLNIEKIDILIDSQPGGSTASLPNRIAAFQPWDAWDYAIIMDGWYKALIPSMGTNTVDNWRENALRADRDILLVGDPAQDIITAFVSKSALGDPTPEDIRSWDIAVCMSSHDFGGEEVLGGIRWVNEFRSEWNFGGGRDGNRDSNLIDLLLVPGTGKNPGLPQEVILDYETPEALARLENGETPVAIEMSEFQDTGPPVIDTGGGGSVVTRVSPLEDAPLALTMRISDDNRVAEAIFRYRSTGYQGGGWQREVPMSFIGNDLWVVDILPAFLDSLSVSPIDSTRYLEFEVFARDVPSGDPAVSKETTSPVTTLEIFPAAPCLPSDSDLASETVSLLEVDGSALSIGPELRNWLVSSHIEEAWTGGAALADTMGPYVELQWDVCNVPDVIRTAPSVPRGTPIGVFRKFFLATADSLDGYRDLTGTLPSPLELSLHYPEAWLPAGVDRDQLAIYTYNEDADRWVLAGGNVNLTGSNVTLAASGTGTYGLFATEAMTRNDNEVISGIVISPNPFSPNGDGLYDECNISFYLNQEVAVTVEVFNIEGNRKNVLAQTVRTSVRNREIRRGASPVWCGTAPTSTGTSCRTEFTSCGSRPPMTSVTEPSASSARTSPWR